MGRGGVTKRGGGYARQRGGPVSARHLRPHGRAQEEKDGLAIRTGAGSFAGESYSER